MYKNACSKNVKYNKVYAVQKDRLPKIYSVDGSDTEKRIFLCDRERYAYMINFLSESLMIFIRYRQMHTFYLLVKDETKTSDLTPHLASRNRLAPLHRQH